jgi:hypothetical protein
MSGAFICAGHTIVSRGIGWTTARWCGEGSFDVPSIADFAAVPILALSVAFIGWAVVRITSRAEK